MNFPLYPFLVSGLYGVWGEANDSLGRLLSALFSVATSLVLFVFARRLFDDDLTALCAAFFFLFFPLNIVLRTRLYARAAYAAVERNDAVAFSLLGNEWASGACGWSRPERSAVFPGQSAHTTLDSLCLP